MVIEANITGWMVGIVHVDTDSSADSIFACTFDKMNWIENSYSMRRSPLGFGGERVNVLGKNCAPNLFRGHN